MTGSSGDIIILLGAGASVDAGIPTSSTMIAEIETLVRDHGSWQEYLELYNHVKSAIHYAFGLRGKFGTHVQFNIETLVNTLYELERNEEHTLYPFIAAWNSRFVGLAGTDFQKVRDFRKLILRELLQWMCPEDTTNGYYYRHFIEVQQHLNYPLHIFTLNYDLCVESIANESFMVESGFSDFGPQHFWDWERFEASDGERNDLAQIYLYKLHGSINWKRNSEKNLYSVEQVANVGHEDMEVIFGRDFKLEAADPYLFYTYQFRRLTLEARLIVVIGYGFADYHINKLLTQALKAGGSRRLLAVANYDKCSLKKKRKNIKRILDIDSKCIELWPGTGKSFLEKYRSGKELIQLIPKIEGVPF